MEKQSKNSGPVEPLLTINNAHKKRVTAQAFAPDGESLVSGSDDRTVRRWDVESGNWGRLDGNLHTWGVVAIALSPDGTKVVSVSRGVNVPHKNHCRAVLWDFINDCGRMLAIPDDFPSVCPIFSPDSQLVALKAGTVLLYEAGRGEPAGELPVKTRAYSIAFSPDGKWLAVGRYDGLIEIWDIAKKRKIQTLTGHTGLVQCLAFSPDGNVLASASVTDTPRGWLNNIIRLHADHTIRFWRFPTGEAIGKPVEVGEATTYLTLLADGTWFSFEGDAHGMVRRGKFNSGQRIVKPGNGGISALAISLDGTRLATGDEFGVMRIWRTSDLFE